MNEEKTKIKKKKSKETRYPRPLGQTYQAIQYHNAPEEQKQKILYRMQEQWIELWTTNNSVINNRLYTINDIGQMLGLPVDVLMRRMNKAIVRVSNVLNGKEGTEIARGIFSKLIFSGLEGLALAHNQAKMLAIQQGDKYVPFLTSEVNRAIGNLSNAGKPLGDLLRLMGEHTKVSPINPNGQPADTTDKAVYLTANEAILLLQEQNDGQPNLLTSPELLGTITHEFEGTPNINAKTQNLREIGIKNSAEMAAKLEHTERAEKMGAIASGIPVEVLDGDEFMA